MPLTSLVRLCGLFVSLLLMLPMAAYPQEADAMRLKITKIMDPSGFEKPMLAASSVIPYDWKTEGGVVWRVQGECAPGQTAEWSARSSDGKAAISLVPNARWSANNQGMPPAQGCIPAAFESADQYVSAFISQMPDAKIISVDRDPQTMQILSREPFRSEMPGDPHYRTWWDAASIHFTYRKEGVPHSGTLILMTIHSHMVTGHSLGQLMPLQTMSGAASSQVMITAPTSEFAQHLPAFYLFLKNYRVNPDWQARMDQHNAKISEINVKGARERSEIIRKAALDLSKTYSDISDMSMESWRRQNETSDRMQRDTVEGIRGVSTWKADTPTGQIELPTGYDRAFQMKDESFIVTNDATFNPYVATGQDGTELTLAPR